MPIDTDKSQLNACSWAGMGRAGRQGAEARRTVILLAAFSLLHGVRLDEVHAKVHARSTVLEPAHYKTEEASSSTREEDLVQHVQTEPDEQLAKQMTQEAPHIQFSNAHRVASGELTYQKDSITKEHWREKNDTESTASGTCYCTKDTNFPNSDILLLLNLCSSGQREREPQMARSSIANSQQ